MQSAVLRYLRGLSLDEIKVIAKRSYRHPNGFIKIVLEKFDNGSTTRLHYFEHCKEKSNPHDHGFDFTSKVLVGVLKDVHYSLKEGSEYTEYTLSLDNKSRCSFECSKEVSLLPKSYCYNFQGMQYSLKSDIIHTTECLTPVAITLVQQDPRLKESCDVYVKKNFALEDIVIYDSLSTDELVILLRKIIRLLQINR